MPSPGLLRLKGADPYSKISKPKKKKAKTQTLVEEEADKDTNAAPNPEASNQRDGSGQILSDDEAVDLLKDPDAGSKTLEKIGKDDKEDEDEDTNPAAGKTEAEIRHAERRRQRLQEKLKAQGTKTHKERVEELNRYLSGLSEHHDMPRIGPG